MPPRPSPLQNRCAPDGSLHAVAERALMMGNRGGRLHRTDGTLGPAGWRSRARFCCHPEEPLPAQAETRLTPRATCAALAAGYAPELHPSVRS